MSWLSRIKDGLKKSTDKITSGISSIVTKRKLDDEVLEELEDLLISADLGVKTATEFTTKLAKTRFDQEISDEEIKTALAEHVTEALTPVAHPIEINTSNAPHVVLVVGVNGSGKTTTIGKLAKFWQAQGHQVSLVAGDTFRAAAVEQLQRWGERINVPVMTAPMNADAAGLAFDAIEKAKQNGDDIVIIDTAGRLQNKSDLMAELEKIRRVIQKVDPTAPHTCLLVLDATTGQNAHAQVEIFTNIAGVTGLIMTKLDGTARGGVLVSLADKFNLPIHAIGVGESADDLRPFAAEDFARSLVGIE
ncbi:MAG: signal recognition particle-docking protein FtsY [Alphaproteobacteria bacterium]